jgi:hypothetical protein
VQPVLVDRCQLMAVMALEAYEKGLLGTTLR